MYSLHCYPQQSSPDDPANTDLDSKVVWTKLLKQWRPDDAKSVKCARAMTKYGAIPTDLRRKVWFKISGAARLFKSNPGLYLKLYTTTSAHSDLIEKDLPRTYGKCSSKPSMRKKSRKASLDFLHCDCLRRVLIAYSNLDPSLGYCQGMNYIAGFMLRIFRSDTSSHDEEAFWTFVVMMKKVRSLFIDGMPGFHKVVAYFRRLCGHQLPSLHAQWDSLGIDVYKLVLTPWFHSLFSYPSFDMAHTARIWDLFLTHDFSVVAKVAFTIIASNQKQLAAMEFVEIIDFCKFVPSMKRGGNQLFQKAMSIPLDEKFVHCFRDLTRYDWQINKGLIEEYAQHQMKKLEKRREKLKLERKYRSMQHDEDDAKECEINDQHAIAESDSVAAASSKSHFLTLSAANRDDSESVLSISMNSSGCDHDQ